MMKLIKNSCRKVTFETRELGDRRANEINRENRKNKRGVELRCYFCSDCDGFHLTSMNIDKLKEFNKKKNRINLQKQINYWKNKFDDA
jgi:hypothetical protein